MVADEDRSSARLVLQFQAGQRVAFDRLYLRYFDRVYTYARVVLDDTHEAEDAAQAVFASALKALPAFRLRTGSPFRAWLFRIARNEVLARMNRRRRIDVEDPAPLDRLLGETPAVERRLLWLTDADLVRFVERLPLPQRQALVLRYMLDLPTALICSVLGRSPQA